MSTSCDGCLKNELRQRLLYDSIHVSTYMPNDKIIELEGRSVFAQGCQGATGERRR